MRAAVRACDVMFADVCRHLLIAPAARIDLSLRRRLNELIGAMARLALLAVHQRIAEPTDMTAGHPDLRVHQDRALDPDIMRILLNKTLPPCLLDIFLEFHAQRAEIPRIGQSSVDL